MKRKIRLFVPIMVIVALTIGSLSFIAPEPIPAPQETTYKFVPNQWLDTAPDPDEWTDYYDIKYSVYQITQGGFGFYSEGPFYPNTGNNTPSYENSQWLCSYSTGTYARVWVKRTENSSWTQFGDMYESTWNTTKYSGTNNVLMFTIDMDLFDNLN